MRLIDAGKFQESVERWQRILSATYGKNDEYVVCIEGVLELLEDAPTVDAEPVKHGYWTRAKGSLWSLGKCSVCGKVSVEMPTACYCPNCGAKMDGERREDG